MKIALGMIWYKEGFKDEVTKMYKNGKCQITETWVSEDTGKDCKHVANYVIVTDNNGEQYAYNPKYEEQANPGHDNEDEYSWWARTYACGASNAQEFAEEKKEEENMKAQEMTFAVENMTYWKTVNGYYYKKVEGGKWIRIGKAEWEQAFDNKIQTASDVADVQEAENEREMFSTNPVTGETFYHGEWGAEEQEAKKTREEQAKKSDKQAEDKVNKKKTFRRSKDVAFESNGMTLTSKQVDFLKSLQNISFWDEGINSRIWCDCIAQDNGWNPMSVGAMISTLREKDLIEVGKERVNGKMVKYLSFTDLGKVAATELGLN